MWVRRHTVSTCAVTMMGTYCFNLVGRMGTQTGSLLCRFAVLAGRLKVCSVHVTLETCLVNEYQVDRVFAAFFIIPPNDSFFNYAFKNIAVKFFQHLFKLRNVFFMAFSLSAASCKSRRWA